jgi:hypothetical protein
MKNLEDIKAEELNENEMDKAAGGAIIYKDGWYELRDNNRIIGRYATYDDAMYEATFNGYDATMYASEEDYLRSLYPRRFYR